jgi:hypothetical protein
MPENPNIPRKGTASRKIYDCIERSSDGLTAFEVERACGVMKNQQTHIAKLADMGLIEVVGKRDVEGIRNLDIWGVRSAEKKAKKKRRRPGYIPKQEHDPYECPACGKTIYLFLVDPKYGGDCIEVEPQRRIIVFDGPWVKQRYTNPDTGEERIELLPKEPIVLYEEWTGKLVVGRAATEREVEYFAEHKKLRVPWTIGFEGHRKNCKGAKRWENGKAEEKRRTMDVRWDREKRRFGFFKKEEYRKSMMKDAFTDATPEEVVPPPKD